MRNCDNCGDPIAAERLEALPDTTTCVRCSRETRKIGFNVYNHSKGTAPELVVVNQNDKEAIRLATRASRRSR